MIQQHKPFLLFVLFLFLTAFNFLSGEPVSLEDILKKTSAVMRWDPLKHMGQLSRDGNTIVFRSGDPWMVLNGNKLLVTGTVIEENGRLIFSQEAADTLLRIFGVKTESSNYQLSTILIDPGHGGRDSGALKSWNIDGIDIPLMEKDIVLDISLHVFKLLRKKYPSKHILLTRDNDVYPSLEERVVMANKITLKPQEGMIYLSIHANASLNPKAEGYEVWYLPQTYRRKLIDEGSLSRSPLSIAPIVNALWEEEFTHESIRLADMILEGFQSMLGSDIPNRGRREESWFVVRNAKMASVLVEVGFITNSYEAARLRKPEYLSRIGKAIYNGICDFVDYFEKKGA